MTEYGHKYGKLPAQRPPMLGTIHQYVTGKLPTPPPSVNIPSPSGGPWGMDMNDKLGCCVVAGIDHLNAAWDAEVKESSARPSDPQIAAEYYSLTGGPDSGLVESTTLARWAASPIFGTKIAGYAPIELHDLIGMQQAISFYGGVMFGIALPQSAEQQYGEQQQTGRVVPWTVIPTSPLLGGHCVVGVGYRPEGVWCVTWGDIVLLSYPFLAKYADEAWCPLSQQVQQRGAGPTGIDFASLRMDMPRLEAA